MSNQRNIVLAVALSMLLLLGWEYAMSWFFPHSPKPVAEQQVADKLDTTAQGGDQTEATPAKRTREGGLQSAADIAAEQRELATDLASPARVPIAAPSLTGSINLTGAVIDDLTLNDFRQTVEKDSGPVRLFSPAGTPAQYFAQFGWVGGDGVDPAKLPGIDTRWQVEGDRLAPDSPVTLRWSNGEGQDFAIRFEIDRDYLITAKQTVVNTGAGSLLARPFALINRTDKTASTDTWNVHSGPIGAFDGSVDFGNNYKDVVKGGTVTPSGRADWIGFTDIYWLSALVPDKGTKPDSDFRSLGKNLYRADLIYQPVTVAPGKQVTRTTRLFAGAKESAVLDKYEDQGITNFGLAIDWGWFRWFERPIFLLLDKLFSLVGNFGLAIILLTLIIRGVMFPIAQKQFASMASMRAIQPKMKALQERYKDDKPKLQQETMALYKEEGVNPLAGCLPILIQIPIFFALYKTLILTIEMRHQPFVLWIRDLSAPDPLHILNLFGTLPFDPPSFLAIGPLALLLGVTMFFQFRLNPAAMDPIQQQMFAIMPWVMMFVMAPFAAGLLLYWITSNVLTIAQQQFLYSRHPQLKEQAAKDKVDMARKHARDKKGA
ncbi:membrane protein insertase YidC [Croceicoccus estronivorus]|uniref:membrane protein insertase YidC n=1 Tax=Croceicoccus estronivorus TaxID=1172626 RepID=UPI0008349177|nr:membrane protein insertase YidC [Croceicoccus estronivorus]OCC25463.1 membrane protein insertase YidC [Croceicoccus estronivorus]